MHWQKMTIVQIFRVGVQPNLEGLYNFESAHSVNITTSVPIDLNGIQCSTFKVHAVHAPYQALATIVLLVTLLYD